MPAGKEEQVATPLVEEQALVQQTVINEDLNTTLQQGEASAELQDTSIDKQEQETTRLFEQEVLAEQALVTKDQQIGPQQDDASAEVSYTTCQPTKRDRRPRRSSRIKPCPSKFSSA